VEAKRQLIGGKWSVGTEGDPVETVDPSDGTVLATLSVASADDVEMATTAAHAAGASWPPPHKERADLLRAFAAIVRANASELAELETREQGRPLRQSEGVAAAAAASFEYFSTICRPREETNSRSIDHLRLTTWDPVGVVAHVLPWNFPLSMAANRIAMTIASGCTTVIKPSSVASLSVLRLCELITGELPPGVVNLVLGGSKCGTELVTNSLVRKVSFTGSTQVGIEVMKRAAESVKRVTLELGGKTPYIVFEDADLELATQTACTSAFINQGQSCAATSRILVHDSIVDSFTERLTELTEKLVVGPGLDPATDVGPLISADHRDSVAAYVDDAKQRGAKATAGGAIPEGSAKGSYYMPTLLTNVDNSMPAMREEVFGPVVGIMPFSSEDEAISLANDSQFGLCASLWTGDLSRAQRLTARLEAGVVWVNAAHIVAPDSPWGGVKQSGIGRILGEAGLEGYLEPKQIHIGLAPGGT
jgi:acyl-CoA reductase-like NAD-dependent aldehyde dehydrogenase